MSLPRFALHTFGNISLLLTCVFLLNSKKHNCRPKLPFLVTSVALYLSVVFFLLGYQFFAFWALFGQKCRISRAQAPVFSHTSYFSLAAAHLSHGCLSRWWASSVRWPVQMSPNTGGKACMNTSCMMVLKSHWSWVISVCSSLKQGFGSHRETEVRPWQGEHKILATRPVVFDKVLDHQLYSNGFPHRDGK